MGIWWRWMSFCICTVWKPPPTMGILTFYLGIESLGLSKAFLHFFHDWKSRYFFISGTSWETMSDDGKSQDYCENGKSLCLVHTFIIFFCFPFYHYCLPNDVYPLIFVALDRPELIVFKHRNRVRATLAFAHEIEDFDDLVNPRHLFDCCLGLEPSKYLLEKICWEEKNKIVYFPVPKSKIIIYLLLLIIFFFFFLFFSLISIKSDYLL